ncbi:MAG: hypothetical protein KDD62_10340, partial [Bdellovibrionales bacterium]|nr:hypothetical protein [Bdellovibrionales bacterium]
MKKLPDEIFPDAFKFSNGEYAWPRKTINVALDDIAKSQCAVLGGEAVVLAKDGSVLGLIPHENPVLSPSVWSWETQPQNKNESWNEYCARTAQESLK